MMAKASVTELPADAEPMTDRVNLMEVLVGSVVEIKTASGSTYWVVPLRSRKFRSGKVVGLSITTSSEVVKRFALDPSEVYGDDIIEVGYNWHFGRDGNTSPVKSVRVL